MIFQAWCELKSCSFIFKSFMHVLCHCKIVDMVSVHTTCDTSCFHSFTLFLAFFVAFYMTLMNVLCMCLLVLSSSLSLSRIISSSSSGIARNHHAAAAAGAGCSITGDPYHGKHLKPLKMTPVHPQKVPL